MDAYIYQADVYCADCTADIKRRLREQGDEPPDEDREETFDSGNWPKGPYDMENQESDSPQHCGICRVFLGNALTSEGYE